LQIVPARLGSTQQVVSEDAYGARPVQREMTSLRGTIRSGNRAARSSTCRSRARNRVRRDDER